MRGLSVTAASCRASDAVEARMTRREIEWMLIFLQRAVPRGEQEITQLVSIVEKLRASLHRSSDTQSTDISQI